VSGLAGGDFLVDDQRHDWGHGGHHVDCAAQERVVQPSALRPVHRAGGHDLGFWGAAYRRLVAFNQPQNSRFFLIPGSGMGYLPLASARSGAGESIVNLSAPGAYSWSELSISSKVISWPVCPATRPIEVTRLASTPRFTSL